ncbi:uroporphyrinogen decarboxylase family protein [Candidatus Poribacteria bacterium]
MTTEMMKDGVHAMVPREEMSESARKLRDTYACKPGIPLFRREFGFYCLEEWKKQGMPQDVPHHELFDYGPAGNHGLGQLGWCEAAFRPAFETKVLEDRGEHELVQDFAGRHVLFFKGRRSGFMPEYLDHPVKDMKTWEEDVKWRLDPTTPERYADLEERMEGVKASAARGMMIQQNLIGGYMYLRSLIGPAGVLYALLDMPDVVHDCMKAWFELADAVIARHQEHVTIDEIYFAEDICYNHGILISPDMMREFLFPYYQQLIGNLKSRQIDGTRHLYVQVDTDGFANPVIPVYQEGMGMDVMSPFEVAAGCDVVEIGKQYPGLAMFGGIDKRVLAKTKRDINEHLEYIIPKMRERGGYIPTSDHGVPAEVPYENYLHYRRRCVELGG